MNYVRCLLISKKDNFNQHFTFFHSIIPASATRNDANLEPKLKWGVVSRMNISIQGGAGDGHGPLSPPLVLIKNK